MGRRWLADDLSGHSEGDLVAISLAVAEKAGYGAKGLASIERSNPRAYDTFARADGVLGSTEATWSNGESIAQFVWQFTAGIWTIASGKATSNPGLGSELTTNGGMETGNPPTDWSGGAATATQVTDERTGGVGTKSAEVTGDGTAVGFHFHQFASGVDQDRWHRLSGWSKNISCDPNIGLLHQDHSADRPIISHALTTWTFQEYIRCSINEVNLEVGVFGADYGMDGVYRMDDISLKYVTTADLFAVVDFGAVSVDASVAVTMPDGYSQRPAGLILCLDSITSPSNYIAVYIRNTYNPVAYELLVDKVVAGVRTNLLRESIAYVAGYMLRAVKLGANVDAYYNGVQIGASQTISDVGIVSNDLHGMLNTSSANTLDTFSLASLSSGYKAKILTQVSKSGYALKGLAVANVVHRSLFAYDTFTRSGALGSTEIVGPDGETLTPKMWSFSSGIWTVSGNKATSNPGLGSELLTNGSMETGSPPSSWTTLAGTPSSVADERTGGSGSKSMNLQTAVDGAGMVSQDTALTQGMSYRLGAWIKNIDADGSLLASVPSLEPGMIITSGMTWEHHQVAGIRFELDEPFYLITGFDSAQGNARFDDISLRQITITDLFAVIDAGTPDVDISIAVTLGTDFSPAGLVICLDSITDPQNYILGRVDNTLMYISKMVAGTATCVTNGITYGAGKVLRVTKSGTTVTVYYDDVQIGDPWTVSDAGIISNILHGIMNTDPINTLDTFSLSSL